MLQQLFHRAMQNAPLLLSLTSLFWAGNFVIGRGFHEIIPPLAMATLRWIFAFSLLLPFAWQYLKRDWQALKQNFPIILLLGTLGVGCFNSLAYIGLNHTTALNGLIIQSTGPVLIMVMTLLIYGEKMTTAGLFGVLISLGGVLVIISKAHLPNLLALSLNEGDLWILAAMGIWALYTVFLRKRPEIHPVSFLATTFFIGVVVNLPLFLWEHFTIRQMQISPASLAGIAYISLFPSILAYLFYNRGVALIGSNRAGVFLHLVPLVWVGSGNPFSGGAVLFLSSDRICPDPAGRNHCCQVIKQQQPPYLASIFAAILKGGLKGRSCKETAVGIELVMT